MPYCNVSHSDLVFISNLVLYEVDQMKVTLSITAENGDTQVRKIDVPFPNGQMTKYYTANLIMNQLAGEILDMVRVFQEVEDDK